MKQKSSVYNNASVNTTIAMIVLACLMLGFSVYLTQHYFDVRFPTGLESQSMCNINSFFNCNKATISHASNIAGVPIALFGALVGALTLLGLVFKNAEYERSIYFTLLTNGIGCFVLFCFSLLILHGLCPFCTLYYITSWLLLFLFYKKSANFKPNIGYLAAFAVIVLAAALITKNTVNEKEKAQREVGTDLINQYYKLPVLGAPINTSPNKIATAVNAPIKIAIFSDFECPACKAFSELLPQIIQKYAGKIDVQYFYYPLDNSCNPNIERAMHHYACKAAYIASCMPAEKFSTTHDELFHNQEKFESGYLDEVIKNNNLEKCVADPATKEKVVALINAATPFNIRSTPTFLLNGVKIEGVLPLDQLSLLFDEILKRAK
jgi:protein-disulfide isomerase/uncharacterized membrane protein